MVGEPRRSTNRLDDRFDRQNTDAQDERDQAELTRRQTHMRRLMFILGLITALWLVAALTGAATQEMLPYGAATLVGWILAMLLVRTRIKQLENPRRP